MILLVDGNHLVHLFWHMARSKVVEETGDKEAQPDLADVQDWFLIRLDNMREFMAARSPDTRCVCVFDSTKRTFRTEICEDYKANRTRYAGVIEAVYDAKQAVRNSDEWRGYVSPDGFEADDVIASVAAQSSGQVVIHSPDKDINQCLVAGRVSIIKQSGVVPSDPNDHGIPLGGELACSFFTAADLITKHGFGPERWVDYQCLVGDSADNVKGAQWIGEMTATRIVRTGVRLEDIDPLEVGLNSRQRDHWPTFIHVLPLLREIFTLRNDLEIGELIDGTACSN